MTTFLASSTAIDRLGWVLVHTLWQFALVMLAAIIVCRLMKRCLASARYLFLLGMMAVCAAAPVATWFVVPQGRAPEVLVAPASIASSSPHSKSDLAPARIGDSTNSIIEGVQIAPTQAAQAIELLPGQDKSNLSSPSLRGALEPWLPTVVVVWSIGMLLAACRPLVSGLLMRRLRTVGITPVSEDVRALFDRTMRRLGIAKAVAVVQSALVHAPVLLGYLRPMVLLPAGVVSGLPVSQLEAVLAHELAHVRRHDYLVNLLQTLIETVFYYHPCIWRLSRRIRIERENCCDDWVVGRLDNRLEYGRALVALAEFQAPRRALALGDLLALGAGGGSLVDRIRRIVGLNDPLETGMRGSQLNGRSAAGFVTLAVTGAMAAFMLSWSAAATDEQTPKSDDRPAISAMLPNGATVELLGVGFHNWKRAEWWRPDGELLGGVPRDPAVRTITFSSVNAGAKQGECRELAVRITGVEKRAEHLAYQFGYEPYFDSVHRAVIHEPTVFHVGEMPPIANHKVKTMILRIGMGELPEHVRSFTPEGRKLGEDPADETLRRLDNLIQPVSVEKSNQQTQLLLKTFDRNGPVMFVDYVPVVVDRDGKKHESIQGGGRLGFFAYLYPLPPDRIARFEYRLLAYRHWVTFENIALDPGAKTTVKVNVEALPAGTNFPPPDKSLVRGLDLSGAFVRGYMDALHNTPDLSIPDPANAGSFVAPKNVFQMPLGEKIWLKYPAGSGTFYIEYRPDGTWQNERLYGPILGDPFEMLKLMDVFREQLRPEATSGDPTYRLRLMFRTGDADLVRRAAELIEPQLAGEFLPNSAGIYRKIELLEIVRDALNEEHEAFKKPELAREANQLRRIVAGAEAEIDKLNDSVPDEQYQSATYLQPKIAAKIPDSLWGKPVDGLRLALVPRRESDGFNWNELPADTLMSATRSAGPAQSLYYQLVVENVSDREIKFCGYLSGEEMMRKLDIRGSDGFSLDIQGIHTTIPHYPSYWRLKPSERQLLTMPAVHFMPGNAEMPRAALGYFVKAEPGEYRLRVSVRFGRYDNERRRHIPGKSEWIGVLTTGVQTIRLMQPPAQTQDVSNGS